MRDEREGGEAGEYKREREREEKFLSMKDATPPQKNASSRG
jgi:hypothetical protein